MSWVYGRDGIARWDGEPFPEPHVDALVVHGHSRGVRHRRFDSHAAACAYAAQRAARVGVRQRVEQVVLRSPNRAWPHVVTVWQVRPVALEDAL